MQDTKLKSCGCCKAPAPSTPETAKNRPGLSAIRYRVGTYASFRQAMIESIARKPALQQWTARTSDDYGIALLEMWAYLSDILTFYQERIANEAFLRTARLRASVLRLAALLDYKPSPGVAATAYLAFTLEKGKQVKIPVGLLTQSVPGQGEKPQKFETIEVLQATAALGKVRAFPAPTASNPYKKGSQYAVLRPSETTSSTPSPGDSLLFFQTGHVSDSKRGIEQKTVVSVDTDADGYKTLSWTPAMQKELPNTARAFKLVRVLRIFGHDAPAQYLKATPAGTKKEPHIKTELVPRTDYSVSIKKGLSFGLDSLYDDLKPGTRLLLLVKDGYFGMVTVDTVGQGKETKFDPLADTVTQITVQAPIYPAQDVDRRNVVLYELGDEILFWKHTFDSTLKVGSTTVCVEAEDVSIADVRQGQSIILADGTGAAELATVKGTPEAITYGGSKYLKITLKSPLTRKFVTATTYLYGNVAKATHGETVSSEVLGSGDASDTFQTFTLKKSPVTFVPKAGAASGAASTLQIYVDKVLWKETQNFYGYESDDRVYTTAVDDDEELTVRFGDGTTGARLTTGRNNVTATYRQGMGQDGNVKASTITTLLDRPVGLKGVTNPLAAQGGADAETLKKARANAPNTVRTFGRIVSLRDFEDAAREFAGVAKARAACAWDGEERVVHLTVAGDKGKQVTGTTHKNLVSYLDARRDPNRKLVVATSYGEACVKVQAVVRVHADYVTENVRKAAEKALQNYFAFENRDLGEPVHLSDVYQALQNVTGVVAADIEYLNFKTSSERSLHGATEAPVQAHLRIFHTELAVVKAATDISVTVGLKQA